MAVALSSSAACSPMACSAAFPMVRAMATTAAALKNGTKCRHTTTVPTAGRRWTRRKSDGRVQGVCKR